MINVALLLSPVMELELSDCKQWSELVSIFIAWQRVTKNNDVNLTIQDIDVSLASYGNLE